ncbi:MAG: hypothetical protein QOE14_2969 [Humisphaera sp.]|nr:hypothetical protein [Humisphaera sp.]
MVCLLALMGAKAEDSNIKKIEIKDRKYAPAKVTIKAGQTIVWTNRDDSDHAIVADDGSFASDDLGSGESVKFTFKKKGKFKYHCKYHPREKGEITVE